MRTFFPTPGLFSVRLLLNALFVFVVVDDDGGAEVKTSVVEDEDFLQEEKKRNMSILHGLLGHQANSAKPSAKTKTFRLASHSGARTYTQHIPYMLRQRRASNSLPFLIAVPFGFG